MVMMRTMVMMISDVQKKQMMAPACLAKGKLVCILIVAISLMD